MPAWSEYKEMAQARGALAMEFYVVTSFPAAGPDAVKECLPGHLEYQKAMEAAGSLVMAGPISDEGGAEMIGAGLIIYRAANFDDARKIAKGDPMHATGAREFTLRRWLVNEGNLSVSVRLSTQSMQIK